MLSRKSRRLKASFVAATMALILSSCSEGSTDTMALDDVNVGYIGDYGGASLAAIAEEEGFWEKHGLNANLSVFTNGPLQIQAMQSGDLDIGYIGPGAFWMPITGQAKILTINGIGGADRIIAQPGITELKQLRGKTVGVPEGTSGQMILALALKEEGMSLSDVDMVPMDPSTVVASFSAGKIDAAGIWYPLVDTIKEEVPDLNELAENSDYVESMAFPNAIVARDGFVEENEEVALKVQAALRDALDYRVENPEPVVEMVADLMNLDAEKVQVEQDRSNPQTAEELDELWNDGTIDSWLNGMGEYFVETGTIDSFLSPTEYYEGDLLEQAGSN